MSNLDGLALVYAVGFTGHYDRPSESQELGVVKVMGGKVWRTREGAKGYLAETGQIHLAVYGVLANWKLDTKPPISTPFHIRHRWRELMRDSKIVSGN